MAKNLVIRPKILIPGNLPPEYIEKYCLLEDNYTRWVGSYFKLSEFAIPKNRPDAGFVMDRPRLHRAMDLIRLRLHMPTVISNSSRTDAYEEWIYKDRPINPPDNSFHKTGEAADFKCPGALHEQVRAAIEWALEVMEIPGGCYYVGAGWWHVDVRDEKWRGSMIEMQTNTDANRKFTP